MYICTQYRGGLGACPPGNFCIIDSLRLLLVHSQVLFKAQLKEFASNDTFKTLFPKIDPICLSIPVMTASVERSFSQMKLFSNEAY